jgi:ribosomal protein S18 acetylase RimI-like enzyme
MIRPYKPGDLPVIMDIANRAWEEIHRMFEKAYDRDLYAILIGDPKTRKGNQVKAHCERHPKWALVCEHGGKIVGFVTFSLDKEKRVGEILENAVDPDCGLKGKGQEMYAAVLGHFREKNMAYAKVRTGMDYAHGRARRAYERAGFDLKWAQAHYYKKLSPDPA